MPGRSVALFKLLESVSGEFHPRARLHRCEGAAGVGRRERRLVVNRIETARSVHLGEKARSEGVAGAGRVERVDREGAVAWRATDGAGGPETGVPVGGAAGPLTVDDVREE